MRSHPIIIATLLSVVTVALCSSVASANPLLSGYGGPGDGNQAILGSTLIGGSSGAGAGGGGAEVTPSSLEAHGPAVASDNASSLPSRGAGAGNGDSAHAVQQGNARPRAPQAQPQTSAPGSGAGAHSVPSQVLGVSNSDLLYILIALIALVATGVTTWRFTRAQGVATPAAKGTRAATRVIQ